MKRLVSTILFLLFLIQSVLIAGSFPGPPEIGERNGVNIETSEYESPTFESTEKKDEGDGRDVRDLKSGLSRNFTSHFENGISGGSYFDGFDDNAGIESRKNVYLDDGLVRMDWWNLDWSNRRAVTIVERSGNNLTDHPVLLILNLSNFDYSGAKSNGGDIRFMDENSIQFSYWIEVWNRSGESRIWVKMPYLAARESALIWMYYGNQAVFSLSNGSATFDLFDDFDDGDISDWNNASAGIEGGGSEFAASPLQSVSPPNSARLYGSRDGGWGTITLDLYRTIYAPPGPKRVDFNVVHRYPGASAGSSYPEKTSVRINDAPIHGPSCAVDMEWKRNGTATFYERGPIKLGIRLERHGWTVGTEAYFDNLRVRRYAATEPIVEIGEKGSGDGPFLVTSRVIEHPSSYPWDHLYLQKTEPTDTEIRISVLDAETNNTIPGYHNVTAHSLDLSQLNYMDIDRIYIKAFFIGNGAQRPVLDSWGIEWEREDTWRDSFVSASKLADTGNLLFAGNISLAENTVAPGKNVTALWHFDEMEGGIARDASGNSNDGIILEARQCEGFFGNALHFDGVDDAVNAEISGLSSEFSVEMRIKPDFPSRNAPDLLNRLFASDNCLGTYHGLDEVFLFTDRNDSLWDVMGTLSDATIIGALVESSDGAIYAGTGPNGDVFKTVDDGANWQATGELAGATRVNALMECSDGAVYAATSPNGKIFKTVDGGQWWNGSVEMGIPVTSGNCLLESKSGHLYSGIGSGRGFVIRSPDRGESWENTGDLPMNVTSVNTLLETSDGVIYAGTSPDGKVFHSTNNGTTWVRAGDLPNAMEINSMMETAEGILLAGGSDIETRGDNSAVYRSTDEGITWMKVNVAEVETAVHSLLETSNGTVYAGTGGRGQVFRSPDQGITWTESGTIPVEGNVSALLESTNGLLYGGSSRFFRTGGDVTNTSAQSFTDDEWVHLVFVYDGLAKKIYVNGRLSASSKHIFSSNHTLFRIGGDAYGQGSDGGLPFGSRDTSFRGVMDEVAVYEVPLSPVEVLRRAKQFRHESIIRSVNITLPEDKVWASFATTRYVPENTILNLSMHDSDTGEILWADNGTVEELSVDMMGINAVEHPAIYLAGYIRSNSTRTPVLFDWAVNWAPIGTPRLLGEIGNITLVEDMPQNDILNLSIHFDDIYSEFWPPAYTLEYVRDDANFTLGLSDHTLGVSHFADNWSGDISLVAKCTNVYGLSGASNVFHLLVTEERDLPAWVTAPPSLVMEEDTVITTDHSLRSYVFDAENDALDFTVTCPNYCISAAIDNEKRLVIESMNDFYGDAELILTVYEVEDPDRSARVTISLEVNPVNDAPHVTLISPVNNSVIRQTSVVLEWQVSDVDDDMNEVYIDLYMGTSYPPGVHTTGIVSDKQTISGLEDEITFYWYIKAGDGSSFGTPENGIRTFTVNTSAKASVTLSEPESGMIVNTTGINFTWRPETSYPDTMYHILLGPSRDTMSEIGKTGNGWFFYDSLEDMTTYWWTVIPHAGDIVGTCDSGVWNFTLDRNFEAVYNLDLHAENREVVMGPGEEPAVRITLTNLGNVPLHVDLETTGKLREHVVLGYPVKIPVGGSHVIELKIVNSSEIDKGTYYLNIVATFQSGRREISITVRITGDEVVPGNDDETDGDDDIGGNALLTRRRVLIAAFVILALLILVVLLIFMRKRSKVKVGSPVSEPGVKYREHLQGANPEGSKGKIELSATGEMENAEIEDVPDGPDTGDEEIDVRPGNDSSPDPRGMNGDGPAISKVQYGYKGKERVRKTSFKGKTPKYMDGKGKVSCGRGDEPPKVAPASESVKCGICFGIVKTGLPLVTCSCGRKYHISCFERVGECPSCGLDMSSGIGEPAGSNDFNNKLSSIVEDLSKPPGHATQELSDMKGDPSEVEKEPVTDETDGSPDGSDPDEYHIEI